MKNIKRRLIPTLFLFLALFFVIAKFNTIAIYANENSALSINLDGNGTIDDPFLISSLNDLCFFRDSVNQGTSYENQYVRQTCNIDLSSIGNWEPIGKYGTNAYFYGTYDGNGYSISNLQLIAPGENVGFFGVLGGTVINFGIESGNIEGACVGGITSHGVSGVSSQIINCYNKATIYGTSRAGGIADNLSSGQILGCYNEGNIQSPNPGGICSYSATSIFYCISTQELTNSFFQGECILLENSSNMELENELNRCLAKTDLLGKNSLELLPYTYDSSGVCHKKSPETISFNFKGTGTKKDPYQINSVDDLIQLRDYTNLGHTFSSCYFVQTTDIDLKEISNWIPIGSIDTFSKFSGIYDGLGHQIFNISCTEDFSSLFGLFGGSLLNLGIESGTYIGQNCSSLVSYLTGNGIILNCYSSSILSGNTIGGLCLENGGRIICSWFNGEMTGASTASITSAGSGTIEYCYGKTPLFSYSFSGYQWESSEIVDIISYKKDLNQNLSITRLDSLLKQYKLNKLEVVSENLHHSNKNITTLDTLVSILSKTYLYYIIPFIIILFIVMFYFAKIRQNKPLIIKKDTLYLFFLILLSLIFNLLFVNRSTNHIVGWQQFCAHLFDEGKIPYRDYYYYLPPLYLYIARLIIKVTGGNFLLYRCYGILERIIIQVILYKVLNRYFKPAHAWIASFVGELIACSTAFDGYGDYNQTRKLILILNIYFFIKYFEDFKTINKKYLWLILLGITLGLQVICVQTGIAIIATYYIVLLWYYLTHKKGFKDLLILTVSLLIPIGICIIALYSNNSLTSLVEQLFLSGNSKGSVNSLLSTFIKNFIQIDSFIFSLCLFALIALKKNKSLLKNKKWYPFAIYIDSFILLHCFIKIIGPYIGKTVTAFGRSTIYLILFEAITLICLITYQYINNKQKLKAKEFYFQIFFVFLTIVSLYINICINYADVTYYYSITEFTNAKGCFQSSAFYFTMFFILYEFINLFKKKQTQYPIGYLIIAASSAVLQFIGYLGSGTNTFSFFLSLLWIPMLVCILFKKYLYKKKGFTIVTAFSIALLCSLTIAQRINCPYSWYGWKDDSLTENDYYSIDLDGMEGYRVNKKTKVTLEQITKLITENSDTDDFVFSFPHIKLYNILSNRYEMDTFVPCYWFDVCSDTYAEIDAEILQNVDPDLIVWCDVGESAWTIHEQLFRGGNKSSQRQIQTWFNEKIESEEYILIGEVYNVSVYKRNDGIPANYTYFYTENDFIAKDYEVQYTKMTSSFANLYTSDHLAKYLIYAGILLLTGIVIKKNKSLWKKILILHLGVNLIFNIHPVYYLCYSLVALIILYQKKLNRNTLPYFVFSLTICFSAFFGYTLEWYVLKYFCLYFCAGLFIFIAISTLLPTRLTQFTRKIYAKNK